MRAEHRLDTHIAESLGYEGPTQNASRLGRRVVSQLAVWGFALPVALALAVSAGADPVVTVRCEAYEHQSPDAENDAVFLGVFYASGNSRADAITRAEYDAFRGHPVLPRNISCKELIGGPSWRTDPEAAL